MEKIRNFCIIAHIDHGKSTLADRMLEITNTVSARDMKEQLLDQMELEREKGITIKLQPVSMNWKGYELNLIDTPGHVDFSYEVSRSLAACEGAVLVIDAAQGIQAQTLANVYLAIEANLTIIPVVNKIDLPSAQPDKTCTEVAKLIGCDLDEVVKISAKDGTNIEIVLNKIIEQIPPPRGNVNSPTRALVFDSIYDDYRGVVLYVRLIDGFIKPNDNLLLMASGKKSLAIEIGYFKPVMTPKEKLSCGEIGYVVTNLKSIHEAQVGDTLTLASSPAKQPLEGYKKIKPYVYAGFFPISAEDYPALKDALQKLTLNDAALEYEPENSRVMGFGFRLGFLGLLHLEIIKERLEREYGLSLVIANPSVEYQIVKTNGEEIIIKNASELPDSTQVLEIKEPWIKGEVIVPSDYLGSVIQLINSIRGYQTNLNYIDESIVLVSFEAPLAKILTDFYNDLKSITSGYGSFNYEMTGYKTEDLVKVDILIGGELVDSLSIIVHRSESQTIGRQIIERLKKVIPRQLFEISLQAVIGGKVIARENIKALGKNVTAKLYGGDVTRKNKLLEKQKRGKKRLKSIGRVEIPTEAFMVLVKKD